MSILDRLKRGKDARAAAKAKATGVVEVDEKDNKKGEAIVENKSAKKEKKASKKVVAAKKTKKTGKAAKEEKAAQKAEKKAEKKKVTRITGDAHKILIRPIVTEKATMTGTYYFEVSRESNKSEIKKAINNVYGVTPKHVRVMNVQGKSVRWNYKPGTRSEWKKAIIRLNKGETINVYEGT